MRARERRLGRSFRRIVASLVAAPVAAGAACHASGSGEAPVADASSDSGAVDAGPPLHDATTGWSFEACAAVPIDGAGLSDPDGCSTFFRAPCGLPPDPLGGAPQVEGCVVDLATCVEICGTHSLFCLLGPPTCTEAGAVADAATIVNCVGACGIAGRPPRGLVARERTSCRSAGEYFAAVAHLEAASVRAFRDLERSLLDLGAPPRLVRGARRAAADERRHARATRRLARRFGGTVAHVRVRSTAPPSLVELLEDDAVTGCVGEAFAALVATWQGERAGDARARRVMRAIAADETRHAALAWEILHWGLPRVSRRDRARVRAALQRALANARSVDTADDARAVSGHPTRADERRLAHALVAVLRREAKRAA